MFKSIIEFFFGKPPVKAKEAEAPYKVEVPVVDTVPSIDAAALGFTQVAASADGPEAPVKKERAQRAPKAAAEKAAKPKKPAAMTAKKPGRKPKAK